MASTDAMNQVTQGKDAMLTCNSRLNEADIQAIVAYVLDQSAKVWKK